MVKSGPKHSPEEFRRRGMEFFERDIQPGLSAESKGMFVAIDIETGMYEIDKDTLLAVNRLYARRSDAQPFVVRVGFRAVAHPPLIWEEV